MSFSPTGLSEVQHEDPDPFQMMLECMFCESGDLFLLTLMAGRLQKALNDPCLLVFTPLCNPFSSSMFWPRD